MYLEKFLEKIGITQVGHYTKSNSYVIDLYEYSPVVDQEFKDKFYLEGHMNPAGYRLAGVMISSYIDYIIRNDFQSFKQVGFIGTQYYKKELE